MFLSQPCNVSDYGMIYAGVQKNVGPAGMVIVIIREGLIRETSTPRCPSTCATTPTPRTAPCTIPPNCWAIYCCGKVFKYLKSIGGLEEMHKRNIAKAKVIYDFLDSSKMFHGTVEPEFRSLMNIPSSPTPPSWMPKSSPPPRLRATITSGSQVCRRSARERLQRHAHRGRQALVDFLKKFEAEHK